MKSFNSPKTALETKSASKNRAEKDYEVVDLKYWDHLETYLHDQRLIMSVVAASVHFSVLNILDISQGLKIPLNIICFYISYSQHSNNLMSAFMLKACNKKFLNSHNR